MNTKRRADLHRRLSMGAVPRPPDGLSERIKADIPKYLRPEAERGRFAWSMGVTMRVAASLILLTTSVFVALNVVERNERPKAIASRPAAPVPAVERYLQRKAGETAVTAAPSEEIRLDIAEDAAPQRRRIAPDDAAQESAPSAAAAVRKDERKESVAKTADSRIAVGGIAEADAVAADFAELESAPSLSQPHPPAAPIPTPAPPPPPPAESPRFAVETAEVGSRAAAAPGIVAQAYADEFRLAPASRLFGIAVDPNVFTTLKRKIEAGERPSTSDVDIEAIVNYFAGAPARPPRRGLTLDVEASPTPLTGDGERAILRFTVDTAPAAAAGSIPPVARDARIEIDINRETVARARRVGKAGAPRTQPLLLHGVSVTGLYELELEPALSRADHVATVRLIYRSVADGKERTIRRIIRGRDLVGTWSSASRRHRLASLGALWGETLRGTTGAVEIARRAQELSAQEPADERARELATAASATKGGG